MCPANSSPRDTSDTVYRYQLRVFQVCFLLVCALPCVLVFILLLPALASFMGSGPQRSSMLVIKSAMLLAPGALLCMALAYAANLLAAILNVLFIRLRVPALQMPQARELLLQFYADPRWLKRNRGSTQFSWWMSLWALIAGNQRLLRLCRRLTAWTVARLYAESRP